MNKLHKILVLAFFAILSNGTKKKVVLEVNQDGCGNFKIDGASYNLLSDPCDDISTNLTFDVSFNFNGDSACLYLIETAPEFYNTSNVKINGVNYTTTFKAENFYISGKTVTFTYDVTFASLQDAQDFNYMILKFHTENVTEDESKEAQLRINTPCTIVTKDMYTVNTDTIINIPTSATSFKINLWDHAAEDGDRVSVYLNGTWIIDNHSLLNEPGTDFFISTSYLISGKNDLVVLALNQGTSGPNTASIAVNNGKVKIDPNLETGEAVQLNF